MEKILEQYLKSYANWDTIYIGSYNVNGAVCSVTFYTDDSRHYKETLNINIWDMMIFITS